MATPRPTTARSLGVFAKLPTPGQVKTRLATAIGPDAAATVYEAMLRDVVRRLQAVRARRVLVYTPASGGAFFAAIGGRRFELAPQMGRDLGDRMTAFFDVEFARGSRSVVIVGSDSPDLPIEHIERAFAALDRHDVVVGPCDDGGFYLIGLAQPVRGLFDGVAWSRRDTLAQTLVQSHRLGLRTHTIDSWYDVDAIEDLHRLRDAVLRESLAADEFFHLRQTAEFREHG